MKKNQPIDESVLDVDGTLGKLSKSTKMDLGLPIVGNTPASLTEFFEDQVLNPKWPGPGQPKYLDAPLKVGDVLLSEDGQEVEVTAEMLGQFQPGQLKPGDRIVHEDGKIVEIQADGTEKMILPPDSPSPSPQPTVQPAQVQQPVVTPQTGVSPEVVQRLRNLAPPWVRHLSDNELLEWFTNEAVAVNMHMQQMRAVQPQPKEGEGSPKGDWGYGSEGQVSGEELLDQPVTRRDMQLMLREQQRLTNNREAAGRVESKLIEEMGEEFFKRAVDLTAVYIRDSGLSKDPFYGPRIANDAEFLGQLIRFCGEELKKQGLKPQPKMTVQPTVQPQAKPVVQPQPAPKGPSLRQELSAGLTPKELEKGKRVEIPEAGFDEEASTHGLKSLMAGKLWQEDEKRFH